MSSLFATPSLEPPELTQAATAGSLQKVKELMEPEAVEGDVPDMAGFRVVDINGRVLLNIIRTVFKTN